MAAKLFTAGFFFFGACGGDPSPPEPSCVDGLSTSCMPLYTPPTFDTLFDKILRPTCAQGRGTCHTSDAQKAGLEFEDAGITYDLLLGKKGGRARVIPSDPACSILENRVESNDPNTRMPPGPTPLLASERCMITQWIANGAAR